MPPDLLLPPTSTDLLAEPADNTWRDTVIRFVSMTMMIALLFLGVLTGAAAAGAAGAATGVRHETLQVQGVRLAYREAGTPGRPALLLLHGRHGTSAVFDALMPTLAARYHVIAPDLPGFGASSPIAGEVPTLAGFAEVIAAFAAQKGMTRYTLYMTDYGALVGFLMFVKEPARVAGFIIQNGGAGNAAQAAFLAPVRHYWQAAADPCNDVCYPPSPEARQRHAARAARHIAAARGDALHLALARDYAASLAGYPRWQRHFATHRPPVLVLFGEADAPLHLPAMMAPEAGALADGAPATSPRVGTFLAHVTQRR